MTKTLLLLRHAKSDWDDESLVDHERPLNSRGQRSAAAIGRYLRSENIIPDLVLSSGAVRCRNTLAIMSVEMGTLPPFFFKECLYLSPAPQILATARNAPEEIPEGTVDTIMMIGHNPGLQELALHLIGEDSPRTSANVREKFPTAALIGFRAEVKQWKDFSCADANLLGYVTPALLHQHENAQHRG